MPTASGFFWWIPSVRMERTISSANSNAESPRSKTSFIRRRPMSVGRAVNLFMTNGRLTLSGKQRLVSASAGPSSKFGNSRRRNAAVSSSTSIGNEKTTRHQETAVPLDDVFLPKMACDSQEWIAEFFCALGRNRTCDPQDRNLMLYPLSYERVFSDTTQPTTKTKTRKPTACRLKQLCPAKYGAFSRGCQSPSAPVFPRGGKPRALREPLPVPSPRVGGGGRGQGGRSYGG
jgi:hypothetical protein